MKTISRDLSRDTIKSYSDADTAGEGLGGRYTYPDDVRPLDAVSTVHGAHQDTRTLSVKERHQQSEE